MTHEDEIIKTVEGLIRIAEEVVEEEYTVAFWVDCNYNKVDSDDHNAKWFLTNNQITIAKARRLLKKLTASD